MCLRPNTIKKIVSCRSPSLRDVRLHPQPPTQQTQPVIQHTHVAVTPNSWPLVKVQCIGIHALWPGVISTLFNTQWSIHAQHHIPTPCDAHKPKERKKGKVCITLIKKKKQANSSMRIYKMRLKLYLKRLFRRAFSVRRLIRKRLSAPLPSPQASNRATLRVLSIKQGDHREGQRTKIV